jgi:hypothetical protein
MAQVTGPVAGLAGGGELGQDEPIMTTFADPSKNPSYIASAQVSIEGATRNSEGKDCQYLKG